MKKQKAIKILQTVNAFLSLAVIITAVLAITKAK
jgi:hypothetical protein